MIPFLSLSLLLVSPPSPSLPFPVNADAFTNYSLSDLVRLETTLVRPVGAPHGATRSGRIVILQRFAVLDAFTPAPRFLDVRLPNRDPRVPLRTYIGQKPEALKFSPPPAGNYLMLAERPVDGRLPTGFAAHLPDTIDDGSSEAAAPDERLGIALVETPLGRLPRGGSPLGDVLRALALSSIRPRDAVYSALPLWNRLQPITADTWAGVDLDLREKRDAIEGLPALGFFRERLVPLLPRATLGGGDVHAAQFWALGVRWGVPDAFAGLAASLESAVRNGAEESFAQAYDVLGSLSRDVLPPNSPRLADEIRRVVRDSRSEYVRRVAGRFLPDPPEEGAASHDPPAPPLRRLAQTLLADPKRADAVVPYLARALNRLDLLPRYENVDGRSVWTNRDEALASLRARFDVASPKP